MLKSGYVYVAGWSVYKEMGEDQATALVKYDSLGNQQWASRYGSADTDADEGYEFYDHDQPDVRSINVDDSGNVYLTGYLCHSGIGVVGILLQYGPQGNLVRVRKLSTPGERWFGAIVDVDNTGAIYGVGKVIGGGIDVFVVKYRGRQR
jgi:hypothetical protein